MRCLSICTSNCKYDVVRRVASKFGMREVGEESSWNLYWTDLSISIERAKEMKRFQKVNHFPGMTELCRKDLLARNLNRMLKLFPQDYNFFPKTWCFPADLGEAIAYSKVRKSKTFIIKPETGCQGRGIYLTKNLKDIKPYDRLICQVYLSKPFLIDGFKFDLRVYTLITSCDPLRIYVYNDGLVRFATTRYKEPMNHNTSNVFMHLTNYSVNKHSRMFVIDDEVGSKRKISTLNKWLKENNIAIDELWCKIDEVIVKTILAAVPILKHNYHTCFPNHDLTYACFELLGFDILLDWKLKPFLLEVNHSPSFHTDAQLDKDVKESLLIDTFEMLNLQLCDKKKVIEEDRKRIKERLLQGINGVKDSNLTTGDQVKKIEINSIQVQQKWEDEHMGNFRQVYPGSQCEKYDQFFKQTTTSMFQDTASSRAREEASKLQREETDMKIKEEESKRIGGKSSEYKTSSESPRAKKLNFTREKIKSLPINRKQIKKSPQPTSVENKFNYSFRPEIISATEERERIAAMAHRDFLIKSYGMLEQIYLSMKKNGVLRIADERKYFYYNNNKLGYERKKLNSGVNKNILFDSSWGKLTEKSDNFCRSASKRIKLKSIVNEVDCLIQKSFNTENNESSYDNYLKVTCSEIPIYTRSNINNKISTEDFNSEEQMKNIHLASNNSKNFQLYTLTKQDKFNSIKIK
ncbi:tubulin polyglutamylase TTLL13P-like [Leptopilina heterotoma]|uniref:tubulin polyglutamylase TTLL13P-like n=1 Tax=Leptopilina heterotoma TaxID=63436 RepID=UPI001CA7FB7D|nr:tubulin polyglutamylase TTLL13P-like [Leptopilina heterotoma]